MATQDELNEIRERADDLQSMTLHGSVPLKTTMQLVTDIIALLAHCDELKAELEGVKDGFPARLDEEIEFFRTSLVEAVRRNCQISAKPLHRLTVEEILETIETFQTGE